MPDWLDEYLTQITDCEQRESRLTPWERDFIDSLSGQLDAGRSLSPKQAEILNTIWERVTARG